MLAPVKKFPNQATFRLCFQFTCVVINHLLSNFCKALRICCRVSSSEPLLSMSTSALFRFFFVKITELWFLGIPNFWRSPVKYKTVLSRGTGWQARYAGRDGRHLFLWIFPCCLSYNMRNWFDQIWLVDVTVETQLSRLMTRNALSQDEAENA